MPVSNQSFPPAPLEQPLSPMSPQLQPQHVYPHRGSISSHRGWSPHGNQRWEPTTSYAFYNRAIQLEQSIITQIIISVIQFICSVALSLAVYKPIQPHCIFHRHQKIRVIKLVQIQPLIFSEQLGSILQLITLVQDCTKCYTFVFTFVLHFDTI